MTTASTPLIPGASTLPNTQASAGLATPTPSPGPAVRPAAGASPAASAAAPATAATAPAASVPQGTALGAPLITQGAGLAAPTNVPQGSAVAAPGITQGTALPGQSAPQGGALSNTFNPASQQVQYGAPATPSAATMTGAQVGVDPNAVSDNAASLISNGSPILQAAQDASLLQMQDRGLANSSLAVGAGTNALINSADTIGQQNVANSTQLNLANQSSTNLASQTNTQAQNALIQQANQGNINAALALQQGGVTSTLNTEQAAAALNAQNVGATQSSALSTQQADQALNAQNVGATQSAQATAAQAAEALNAQNVGAVQSSQLSNQQAAQALNAQNVGATQNAETQAAASQEQLNAQNTGALQTSSLSAQNANQTQAVNQQTQAFQNQQAAATATSQLSAQYQSQVQAIVQNGNLDAASQQKTLQDAASTYNNSLAAIAKMYGVNVNSLQLTQPQIAGQSSA